MSRMNSSLPSLIDAVSYADGLLQEAAAIGSLTDDDYIKVRLFYERAKKYYTWDKDVCIICALPKEFSCMTAVCDDVQDPDQYFADDIIHQIGYIRNVSGTAKRPAIIVLAPQMGTNLCAVVAALMIGVYPYIQDFIMSGIAGGVPNPNHSEDDIRLGDLVVSSGAGVVQYDFVKQETNKRTSRSQMPKPSRRLLQRAQILEAERLQGRRPWMEVIATAMTRIENGGRPPKNADPNHHLWEEPCLDSRRKPGEPVIHFGIIGSGNVLLKDPETRDEIARQHQVRAVEMESSGLADAAWSVRAGYLVVRGIVDYCDTHKDDVWHLYASLAAAAYTRCIVQRIPAPTKDF